MAKIVDIEALQGPSLAIPGLKLKAPVWDFCPSDDGNPREVDAFTEKIQQMRNRNDAVLPEIK